MAAYLLSALAQVQQMSHTALMQKHSDNIVQSMEEHQCLTLVLLEEVLLL
jgi:hypothetical protein